MPTFHINPKIVLFYITIFLLSLSITVSAADPRIVNGSDAQEGEFKFAVSLRRNSFHTCGATILNEYYILTAAHCVCDDSQPRNSSLFSIQYGYTTLPGDNSNVIPIANITCPDFSSTLLIWDVAVLKLKTPLPNNSTLWETVGLSKRFNTATAQKGLIIGWGLTTHEGSLSNVLQKLNVDIYPDAICNKNEDFVQFHHICFGAKEAGACNGDSGTALLDNNGIQIGIASFITAQCGIANETSPNVYTRVESYYDWIWANVNSGHFERSNILTIAFFIGVSIVFS